MSRAHLHQLVRQLRRYLAWQQAEGTTHFVPADKEARERVEARKQARQKRQLDQLRAQITGDDRETDAPERSAKPETKPVTAQDGPGSSGDDASFDPADTGAGSSDNQQGGADGVTASTPLWKQHGALHELGGGDESPTPGGSDGASDADTESPRPGGGSGTEGETGEQSGDKPQTSAEKMQFLRQYLGDCTRCPLCEERTNIVFGDGDPNAELMFIGEGPGRHEDRQGLPFVGRSGQLLTRMIEAMGLQRSEVYITNVVKCRPPKNRNPAPLEIKECAPFLRKQIEVIEPRAIVTLGKFASNTVLDKDAALGSLRGRWHEHMGIPVMPTYHPAYLLRNEDRPQFKRRSWEDLKMVMERLTGT